MWYTILLLSPNVNAMFNTSGKELYILFSLMHISSKVTKGLVEMKRPIDI